MNIENYIEKDYNHVSKQLQDYMLNRENIQRFSSFKNEQSSSNEKKARVQKDSSSEVKKTQHLFFYPREKDSLFWCFYIIKHGLLNYQMIQYKNVVFEKTQKIEYVDRLRKEKQLLKIYKFASLSNVENNLVNDTMIDLASFLTLCVLENKNILFIRKKTYYELCMNDTNDIYVLTVNENEKYGFHLIDKSTNQMYNEWKSRLFQIDNIDKPMKSVTYYKVADLTDICLKLGISTLRSEGGKSKSKNELYESILQEF
jgi:hypothetical protein